MHSDEFDVSSPSLDEWSLDEGLNDSGDTVETVREDE